MSEIKISINGINYNSKREAYIDLANDYCREELMDILNVNANHLYNLSYQTGVKFKNKEATKKGFTVNKITYESKFKAFKDLYKNYSKTELMKILNIGNSCYYDFKSILYGKTSSSVQKMIKLYKSGCTSYAEISKRLNISHTYVSKSLKPRGYKSKPSSIKIENFEKYRIQRKTGKRGIPIQGIQIHRKARKFQANIVVKGKNIYLGIYDSCVDALDARIKGELKYWGFTIERDESEFKLAKIIQIEDYL